MLVSKIGTGQILVEDKTAHVNEAAFAQLTQHLDMHYAVDAVKSKVGPVGRRD
jgi:hypothetical protein